MSSRSVIDKKWIINPYLTHDVALVVLQLCAIIIYRAYTGLSFVVCPSTTVLP